MNKDELKSILEQHRLWIEGNGGKCVNLRFADLRGADLWRADLRDADLRGADLRCADLRGTDLQGADLQRADLRRADLRGADLDYSCLPLWCGSKGVIVDWRIAAQIAAHFCALSCDDPDFLAAREAVLPFAQTSHRAMELGINDDEEGE